MPITPMAKQQATPCRRAGSESGGGQGPTTVPQMLLEVSEQHSSAIAIIDADVRMDFRSLWEASTNAAARMRQLGVGPGDTVAILLPNSWRYAVAYFGAQLAGAVTVLVNTRFTAREIDYVLTDSAAEVVVSDRNLVTSVPSGVGAVRLLVDVADLVDTTQSSESASATADGLPGLSRKSDDVAQLLYTSGTTGNPKGVRQLHSNLIFNARIVRQRLGAAPGERTLIAAPMFHAIGIVSQLVGFLAAGATCVIMPAFDAGTAAKLVAQEKITIFAGVPAMMRLLLLKTDNLGADISHLKMFVMGGSPVPASLPGEIAAQLPNITLANVWGLTEATSIATYTDGADYAAHPGSAGTPVEGVQVHIAVDQALPDDVRNTVGELCIRGPVVSDGYWLNDSATADTFVDGWLYTGDLGYIDQDGHVYVKDRLKDMIIRGGENIYSLEVENALISHPLVAEVAVIGVPDHVLGERVCAVIVPSGEREPTIEELRVHAARDLADYKVPTHFIFVSELPRNAAGKILKRALPNLSVMKGLFST